MPWKDYLCGIVSEDAGSCNEFFFLGEPSFRPIPSFGLGGRWRHAEECYNSNDKGKETFEEEEPST